MKRPQPDIGEIIQANFIRDIGYARKFKRLWGTTTVGGVEVLHNRRYYYPSSSRPSNFEDLFRFLGIYDDVVNGSVKGVSSAWIYINKNKESSIPEIEGSVLEGTKDFVAYNLNKLWWDDADGPRPENLTLTTSVTIGALFVEPGGGSKLSDLVLPTSTTLLSPTMSQPQLATAIADNFDTIWATSTISQDGVGVINKGSITDSINNITTPDEDDLTPDDPWLNTLARYALRSNGVPCTIRNVEIGKSRRQDGRLYNTYVVTLEIPYIAFTTSSPIVGLIAEDIQDQESLLLVYDNSARPNGYWTRYALQQMDSTDLDDDPDLVSRSYRLWEAVGETNFSSIWHTHGGKHYIKADAFNNPGQYGLKYKTLYEYVASLVDSGYKKKKVKWYKKVLAVVIAIVIVIKTGRVDLAAASFKAIALIIVAVSLTLTILSLAAAALGMESAASAFAAANKAIEPLVIIASIFLFVDGITQKLKEQVAKKGMEEITSEAVLDFLEESLENLVDDFVETIVQGYNDVIAGELTNAAIQFVNNSLKLLTLPQQIKLEKIADRNKDLRAEYEKLQEEMSQEDDLLRGFARIYSRPATADWSYYAQQFDQPYERGGGRLHIGNIQRTTKQALRKADYSDPAFDNILVV